MIHINSGYVLLRFSLLLIAYQVFLAGNTIPITLILIWILTFPLDSPCLSKITFSSFSCNIYILWIEWMSLFQITFSVIFCFLVFFLMSLYYHRGFYLSILFCLHFLSCFSFSFSFQCSFLFIYLYFLYCSDNSFFYFVFIKKNMITMCITNVSGTPTVK